MVAKSRGVARWLRGEGLVLAVLSVLLYSELGHVGWLMFALIFFAPDLGMVGYLAGSHIGAYTYNLAHTYAGPGVLVLVGLVLESSLPVAIGLVWTAHIGLDRFLGYGLKLPTDFRETHLGRIGRRKIDVGQP